MIIRYLDTYLLKLVGMGTASLNSVFFEPPTIKCWGLKCLEQILSHFPALLKPKESSHKYRLWSFGKLVFKKKKIKYNRITKNLY